MSEKAISFCAAAIRPQYWMECYNSLLSNKLEWEIIFVGDVPPNYSLPPNLKYIQSSVKPSQCYEIAFRNASGYLISWFADDATYPPNAVDDMYAFWKSFNNEKIVGAFRTIEDGKDITWGHRLRGRDVTAPMMAPFGIMSRKLFRELGGYDRRFICGQSENDVVMRVYEIGGDVKISPIPVYVHHKKVHESGTLFRTENFLEDRRVLESFWIKDRIIQSKRLLPFEPFDDRDILTKTQCPFGKWV